ncbi:MAG: NAD(P)-dependent oxidoreductase [Veillonellales bacterium]
MDKKVLITGAYGFIGRYVAKYFEKQGWDVIGLGHGEWSRQEWQAWGIKEWHTTDITTDNLLTYANEPDVIIHCAGSGSVSFSLNHPLQDYNRTVQTTLSVLEFARIHAPKAKIIYPSSAAVYGSVGPSPIKENSLLNPVSPYGFHKKIAEELCSSYARFFNISVAIVRLFSIYGVGLRKQLFWDACEKISRNETLFFGSGEGTRDWLHVQDAASILYTASQFASTKCPIVNGGAGRKVTIREVLSELFREFGRSDEPIFQGITRTGDPQHYLADINYLRMWGWKPQFSLFQGIRQYVEWYKDGGVL